LFFPIGSKTSAATPGLSTTPTIETLALPFEYAIPVITFLLSISLSEIIFVPALSEKSRPYINWDILNHS